MEWDTKNIESTYTQKSDIIEESEKKVSKTAKYSKHKAKVIHPELSDEEIRERNKQLERENAELREANEILKDALVFFAKDRKK